MSISFSHDHVGLSVTAEDLDATIEWYTSRLGFALDRRFDSHGTTFAYMISGDVKIELMAGASNRQAPTDDVLTSMDPARLHHFCLAVEDLDAAVSQLGEQDVALIGGPMEVADIGQRIAFIGDNLGNIIELAEPAPGPKAEFTDRSPHLVRLRQNARGDGARCDRDQHAGPALPEPGPGNKSGFG